MTITSPDRGQDQSQQDDLDIPAFMRRKEHGLAGESGHRPVLSQREPARDSTSHTGVRAPRVESPEDIRSKIFTRADLQFESILAQAQADFDFVDTLPGDVRSQQIAEANTKHGLKISQVDAARRRLGQWRTYYQAREDGRLPDIESFARERLVNINEQDRVDQELKDLRTKYRQLGRKQQYETALDFDASKKSLEDKQRSLGEKARQFEQLSDLYPPEIKIRLADAEERKFSRLPPEPTDQAGKVAAQAVSELLKLEEPDQQEERRTGQQAAGKPALMTKLDGVWRPFIYHGRDLPPVDENHYYRVNNGVYYLEEKSPAGGLARLAARVRTKGRRGGENAAASAVQAEPTSSPDTSAVRLLTSNDVGFGEYIGGIWINIGRRLHRRRALTYEEIRERSPLSEKAEIPFDYRRRMVVDELTQGEPVIVRDPQNQLQEARELIARWNAGIFSRADETNIRANPIFRDPRYSEQLREALTYARISGREIFRRNLPMKVIGRARHFLGRLDKNPEPPEGGWLTRFIKSRTSYPIKKAIASLGISADDYDRSIIPAIVDIRPILQKAQTGEDLSDLEINAVIDSERPIPEDSTSYERYMRRVIVRLLDEEQMVPPQDTLRRVYSIVWERITNTVVDPSERERLFRYMIGAVRFKESIPHRLVRTLFRRGEFNPEERINTEELIQDLIRPPEVEEVGAAVVSLRDDSARLSEVPETPPASVAVHVEPAPAAAPGPLAPPAAESLSSRASEAPSTGVRVEHTPRVAAIPYTREQMALIRAGKTEVLTDDQIYRLIQLGIPVPENAPSADQFFQIATKLAIRLIQAEEIGGEDPEGQELLQGYNRLWSEILSKAGDTPEKRQKYAEELQQQLDERTSGK